MTAIALCFAARLLLTLRRCAYRRFYLEIEGKQRFRVVECWEQDGYRVARPEYFSDSQPPAASEAQANLQSLCQSVDQLASVWLDKVRYMMPAYKCFATLTAVD